MTSHDEAVQLSFMITLAQKDRLRQLGYDEAAISAMTPQEAHRSLGLRS
jgi:hypothetical protein